MVCRRVALYKFWAMILPTLGGFRGLWVSGDLGVEVWGFRVWGLGFRGLGV